MSLLPLRGAISVMGSFAVRNNRVHTLERLKKTPIVL